jgi:hypothetical protein
MSQFQRNAVSLARGIIAGTVAEVSSEDFEQLRSAASMQKCKDLELIAHKVIRDFTQRKGVFADLKAA